MTTKTKNRKDLTPKEIQQRMLAYFIEKLKDRYTEGQILEFIKAGGINKEKFKWKHIYKTKPLTIKEFLESPYHAGSDTLRLWKEVKKAIIEVVEGKYHECVLTGAIGIGKTSVAQFVNLYYLYLVSLMKDPHKTFGLMSKGLIVFVMLN